MCNIVSHYNTQPLLSISFVVLVMTNKLKAVTKHRMTNECSKPSYTVYKCFHKITSSSVFEVAISFTWSIARQILLITKISVVTIWTASMPHRYLRHYSKGTPVHITLTLPLSHGKTFQWFPLTLLILSPTADRGMKTKLSLQFSVNSIIRHSITSSRLTWHFTRPSGLSQFYSNCILVIRCRLINSCTLLYQSTHINNAKIMLTVKDHLGFCLHDVQWTRVDSHFAVFSLRDITFNLPLEHHAWHYCWRLDTLALPTVHIYCNRRFTLLTDVHTAIAGYNKQSCMTHIYQTQYSEYCWCGYKKVNVA